LLLLPLPLVSTNQLLAGLFNFSGLSWQRVFVGLTRNQQKRKEVGRASGEEEEARSEMFSDSRFAPQFHCSSRSLISFFI